MQQHLLYVECNEVLSARWIQAQLPLREVTAEWMVPTFLNLKSSRLRSQIHSYVKDNLQSLYQNNFTPQQRDEVSRRETLKIEHLLLNVSLFGTNIEGLWHKMNLCRSDMFGSCGYFKIWWKIKMELRSIISTFPLHHLRLRRKRFEVKQWLVGLWWLGLKRLGVLSLDHRFKSHQAGCGALRKCQKNLLIPAQWTP